MSKSTGWTVGGAAFLALALAGPAVAQGNGPWLHIRVEEPRRESKVAVNLPLSVVEVALQAAPEKLLSHGHFKLGQDGDHIQVADLRKMWNELKASGDAESLNVEERDQKVRIARAGELVLIHVDESDKGKSVPHRGAGGRGRRPALRRRQRAEPEGSPRPAPEAARRHRQGEREGPQRAHLDRRREVSPC